MWLLDGLECADVAGRDVLLEKGNLLRFANAMRGLSKVWLEGKEATETEKKLESFLLRGGAYGTTDNKVVLGQSKRGGKVGYLVSRVFVPNSKLKRYYPILEKYPWLMPVMQVRRWFMIFNPSVAKMAKSEMSASSTVDKKKSDKMTEFLNEIGL
jgi:hypothetical protein